VITWASPSTFSKEFIMPLSLADEDKALLLSNDEEFGHCYLRPRTILFAFMKYPEITHVAFYNENVKTKVDKDTYIRMFSKAVFGVCIEDEIHIENYFKSKFAERMTSFLGKGWRELLSLISDNNEYIRKAAACDVHSEEEAVQLEKRIREIGKNLAK
jgi:hypothetical protein